MGATNRSPAVRTSKASPPTSPISRAATPSSSASRSTRSSAAGEDRPPLRFGKQVRSHEGHLHPRSQAAAEARLGQGDQEAAVRKVVRGAQVPLGDEGAEEVGEPRLGGEVDHRRPPLFEVVEQAQVGRAAEFGTVLAEENDAVPRALEGGFGEP